MASSELRDRRLIERSTRRGGSPAAENAITLEEMPDLGDNAEFPSDEAIERLAEDLRAEKVARDLCIEHSLAEPISGEPQVVAPPTPLDIE